MGREIEDSDRSGPDEEPPTLQGLVFNKDVYGPGDTLEILFRVKDNFSGISHINMYLGARYLNDQSLVIIRRMILRSITQIHRH